jgi:type I restriction enzyme S subunit
LKEWIIKTYTQGGQPNLSGNIIKSIELNIPGDKSEQIRIANILMEMDSEIDALESKLEKYRQIKSGMMQNLLTGKIRLI